MMDLFQMYAEAVPEEMKKAEEDKIKELEAKKVALTKTKSKEEDFTKKQILLPVKMYFDRELYYVKASSDDTEPPENVEIIYIIDDSTVVDGKISKENIRNLISKDFPAYRDRKRVFIEYDQEEHTIFPGIKAADKGGLRGHFTSIKDMIKNEAKINFLMAKDGIYEIRRNEIGIFSAKTNYVYDLDGWREGFMFALPKIPQKLLLEIINFFKYFCNQHMNVEAMAQIFWDSQRETYFTYIPQQYVGKNKVHAIRNVKLERERLLVLDIHSHNNMQAFFSSRDDADEKETRLYGVVGRIDTTVETLFRFSCGDEFVFIKQKDIFHNDHNDNEAVNGFPLEWINQVHTDWSDIIE